MGQTVNTTSSIQTHGSGVSEVDCVRILDAPPLVHPVDGVSVGPREANRFRTTKNFNDVGPEWHTCRVVCTNVQRCTELRGPWLGPRLLQKQLLAGPPHLLVPACTRKSKATKLVEVHVIQTIHRGQ